MFGYFKVDRRNNILDTVDVDTPPFVRQSHGLWLDIPPVALALLRAKNVHVAGSIHAAEHALLSLTPMFVMSVAGDVRTECKAPEKEFANQRTSRKRPARSVVLPPSRQRAHRGLRLILFDASGKSGGVSAKAFDRVHGLLTQAADVLARCPCIDGCPSCGRFPMHTLLAEDSQRRTGITSSICSQGNVVCSKLGARIVLECLIGRTPSFDSIPMQDPYVGGSPGETIVLAGPVKAGGEVVVVDEEGRRMGKEEAERRVEESRVVMRAQAEARSVEDVVDLEAAMGGFVR